jgi:hypothetical protein
VPLLAVAAAQERGAEAARPLALAALQEPGVEGAQPLAVEAVQEPGVEAAQPLAVEAVQEPGERKEPPPARAAEGFPVAPEPLSQARALAATGVKQVEVWSQPEVPVVELIWAEAVFLSGERAEERAGEMVSLQPERGALLFAVRAMAF